MASCCASFSVMYLLVSRRPSRMFWLCMFVVYMRFCEPWPTGTCRFKLLCFFCYLLGLTLAAAVLGGSRCWCPLGKRGFICSCCVSFKSSLIPPLVRASGLSSLSSRLSGTWSRCGRFPSIVTGAVDTPRVSSFSCAGLTSLAPSWNALSSSNGTAKLLMVWSLSRAAFRNKSLFRKRISLVVVPALPTCALDDLASRKEPDARN
mmetsp:Transcript_19725/g.24333  ORF Transcript_19725/g.24333 Transcript_19725/m.24333 type:complete len:205 (-) Transcript_19725:1736-2350(-)